MKQILIVQLPDQGEAKQLAEVEPAVYLLTCLLHVVEYFFADPFTIADMRFPCSKKHGSRIFKYLISRAKL